jgi:SAM-dependent methyltransferase
MTQAAPVESRFTFNAIAADYDARRPDYPEALFEDLFRRTRAGSAILEVGCGTGKATQSLAAWGRPLEALDPGPDMLAQARLRVGQTKAVRFHLGLFEDWVHEEKAFGLICAGQAWHWIDPAAGYAKAATLLEPRGVLAIFGNVERPLGEPVRSEIQSALEEAFGGLPARDGPLAAYGPYGFIGRQVTASGLFGRVRRRVYSRRMNHSPESYAALTETYSATQRLEPAARERLLKAVRSAVSRAGGVLSVELDTHLLYARPRR